MPTNGGCVVTPTGWITPNSPPLLHVFEQEGGWHWGITVPRLRGTGFKVVAYSAVTFEEEMEARCDGRRALDNLADLALSGKTYANGVPSTGSVGQSSGFRNRP
nr:hypothetical protein [Paraburkholderia silviterrae]